MTDLQTSLRRTLAMFVGIYFLLLVLVLGLISYSTHTRNERLAHSLALAARNFLVVRDLRQTISVINAGMGSEFDRVQFVEASGSTIFSLPDGASLRAHESNPFTIDIRIPISTSEDSNAKLGEFHFTYSMIPSLAIATSVWLLFLLILIPMFYKSRRAIVERHHEIVRIQRAEALHDVARQVSHDIRSPLTAIKTVVSMVRDIPEAQRSLLQNASDRIQTIANDLLARNKTQREEIQTERAELNVLFESVVREKKLEFSNKPAIDIRLDVRTLPSVSANMQPALLHRILSNLLNNSIESITSEGHVTLASRENKDGVMIMVNDNGSGISPEVLTQLGQKEITSEKASGTGIGILNARRAIEAANGSLSIQSRLGVGTLVTITLPCVNC
jgi:signal transduction histidine kinase